MVEQGLGDIEKREKQKKLQQTGNRGKPRSPEFRRDTVQRRTTKFSYFPILFEYRLHYKAPISNKAKIILEEDIET